MSLRAESLLPRAMGAQSCQNGEPFFSEMGTQKCISTILTEMRKFQERVEDFEYLTTTKIFLLGWHGIHNSL